MPEALRELKIKDASDNTIFRIDKTGKIIVTNEFIVTNTGRKELFHVDEDGKLVLKELIVITPNGKQIFYVDKNGIVHIGDSGTSGELLINDEDGNLYACFQPDMLLLYDRMHSKDLSIMLNASGHVFQLYGKTGNETKISLNSQNGTIKLGTTSLLDGKNGTIKLGTTGGKSRMFLDAKEGDFYIGGNDKAGNVFIFPYDYTHNIPSNKVNARKKATIHLDGNKGDIILQNADCAEDFEIIDDQEIEPGSVMVIEQEGKLRQSTKAYDKRVAGIISGAGEHHPGIVLGRNLSKSKTVPIALAGRVFCKVDANKAPVQVGDLMTTSDVPGCAMKATEQAKSFGAVLGKALRPLEKGRSLIPILVALQ